MQRIDGSTATPSRPTPAAVSGTPGYFTGGNPSSSTPATMVTPDWLNAVQEEIAAVIIGAGLTLSKADNAQLFAAIQALITSGGVSFATDAEAIAGVIANKAVAPRAAAALVTDRIAAVVGAAPESLNMLVKLAAAVGNNPNFAADMVAGLAARALASRQVTGSGLASGGGALTDDLVIAVAAASGVELNAQADATKALTPAAYGAAGGGDGSNGWAPLPGGNIIQWGSLTVVGGNQPYRDFTISFPRPFNVVCGSIVGNADPQGSGRSTLPVTVLFQQPSIAGVTGRIDAADSDAKIANRVVRWQAIGR